MKEAHQFALENRFDELKDLYKGNDKAVHECDSDGRTPLHWSCSGGSDRITLWLIETCCVNVDVQDHSGWTPLMICSSAGRLNVIDELVGNGARINHVNFIGCSSLHYACSKGHLEIARKLMLHGASLEVMDDKTNETPLHRAAAKGNLECVRLLVESGANVEATDKYGDTPLVRALESHEDDVALLLIKSGASLEHENKDGVPAHRYSRKEFVDRLKDLNLM